MSRLIVRNSSLVYPPVPGEILRAGDAVLPLVDRFEETVFMAGPGYDALRALFPEFNLRAQALALEIGGLLPEWLGQPAPDLGHSVWQAYSDHFVKFSLGPIHANAFLAQWAARLQPDEVLGWELPSTTGWWAGRHMVAEVAHAIGDASGGRVRVSGPRVKRVLRDAVLPPIRVAQALSYLRRATRTGFSQPDEQTDVLFVVAGPTLVPLYDRIAARLQSDYGLRVMALDAPVSGALTEIAEGEMPRWSLHAYSDARAARTAMAGALCASHTCDELGEGLRGLGASRDLPLPLQDTLERRVHSTVASELPPAWYLAHLWRMALDALNPRVLVSFNAYNDMLAPAVFQARDRGIPTVMLQHGVFGPFFRAGAMLPHDNAVVLGAYGHEMLSPIAGPGTTFVETGHVGFDDHHIDPQLASIGADLRTELLDGHDHLVVVTTQPVEFRLKQNEDPWWLDVLVDACAKLNALLAIKPHPHEKAMLSAYEALADRASSTLRVIHHGEIELTHLIAASDLLVTRFSTTAVEAALLDTPVLIVNFSGGPDQYPYVDEGVAEGVYSPQEMYPTLKRVLTDARTRRRLLARQGPFLDRHLGPRDGGATERVAALISRQVRNGATAREE